jgi:hypothetical protein
MGMSGCSIQAYVRVYVYAWAGAQVRVHLHCHDHAYMWVSGHVFTCTWIGTVHVCLYVYTHAYV